MKSYGPIGTSIPIVTYMKEKDLERFIEASILESAILSDLEATLQEGNGKYFADRIRAMSGQRDQELARAYEYSHDAHKDDKRDSGEEYFNHVLEVAYITAYLGGDSHAIQGALLHDTIEKGHATYEDLKDGFGQPVADIVKTLSFIREDYGSDAPKDKVKAMHYTDVLEYGKKVDDRALKILFADRISNLRTIGHLKDKEDETAQERAQRILSQTRKFHMRSAFETSQTAYGLLRYMVHEASKIYGNSRDAAGKQYDEIQASLGQLKISFAS